MLASSHTSVLTNHLQRAAPDAHEGDHLFFLGTDAASGRGGGLETAELWDWDSFK